MSGTETNAQKGVRWSAYSSTLLHLNPYNTEISLLTFDIRKSIKVLTRHNYNPIYLHILGVDYIQDDEAYVFIHN